MVTSYFSDIAIVTVTGSGGESVLFLGVWIFKNSVFAQFKSLRYYNAVLSC